MRVANPFFGANKDFGGFAGTVRPVMPNGCCIGASVGNIRFSGIRFAVFFVLTTLI
jgi:hypothetical protein